MNIEFIATVSVIAANPIESRRLYVDALGLPLQAEEGSEYFHSEEIEGAKHLAVWPLSQAAEACFGSSEWPADRQIPQMSVEFEVADATAVTAAAAELQGQGFELLHGARLEPWGQTVARLQTVDSLIVGISYTPALHE